MVTTDNLYHNLGSWKEMIVLDLKSTFYQNQIQMHLCIMTPFGGLMVLARSGQVLTSQSEELEELLAKVLKDNLLKV